VFRNNEEAILIMAGSLIYLVVIRHSSHHYIYIYSTVL
jgi:hypothetical protein